MDNIQPATPIPVAPETVDKVRRLLDEIDSSTGARKEAAEAKLHSMGIDGARAIAAFLEPRIAANQSRSRVFRKITRWVALWCVPAIAIYLKWPHFLFLSMAPLLIWLSAFLVLAGMSVSNPPSSSVVDALASLSDKRLLPTLLDVYWFLGVGKVRAKMLNVLIQQLPSLTADDAPILSWEHRKRLNGVLENYYARPEQDYPSEFIVAILKALGQVGDKSSLPSVKRLAERRRDSPVRQAARDCLARLQERSNPGVDSLLRAAAPAGQPEQLLRASTGGAIAPAEELLRPDASRWDE